MLDLDGDDFARKAAAWTWTNRQWIAEKLSDVRNWLFGSGQEESAAGILIIGPGGVGKSTAARTLAGGYDAKPDIPGEYEESIHVESYKLKDDEKVELIVPPGQRHRRDSTWGDLQAAIAGGETAGSYSSVPTVIIRWGYSTTRIIVYIAVTTRNFSETIWRIVETMR